MDKKLITITHDKKGVIAPEVITFIDNKLKIKSLVKKIAILTEPNNVSNVRELIKHSYYWVIAVNSNKEVIGSVFLVSDGVFLAYVQNLNLRKDYRGKYTSDKRDKSIAYYLVNNLLSKKNYKNKDFSYVFEQSSEKKVRDFFKELGFKDSDDWTEKKD